jgi:transposase
MIGGMSMTGLIASLTFRGGTTKSCFLEYVQKVLVPVLWRGAVVIMDNLNVHLNQAVREAIEAVGARVQFLPRYCHRDVVVKVEELYQADKTANIRRVR